MDSAALRDQLESHHTASFAWALHCCDRDRQEAEEVLQTVYLKIIEGKARYDGRSSLRTWLFAVIRRTAADARRRHILRRLRFLPLGHHDAAAATPLPDKLAHEAERNAALAAALAELPPRQRQVLLLVFYHGHTVDEAAAILRIGTGSARTHYARGKQRLRERLSGSEVLDDARTG